MPKPHAVPKSQICSECGLDWSRHPKNVTVSDCVKLLKVDLENAEWRASFNQPKWIITGRPYWPYSQPYLQATGTSEGTFCGAKVGAVKDLPANNEAIGIYRTKEVSTKEFPTSIVNTKWM